MTLIQALDRALQNLNEAKRINDEMQASKVHGSAPWHQHETIDGKIFDATAAIERQIEVNHQELAEQIITKKVVAGQCELSEAQLRLIGQNPVSGESRGFAEECAMQYGGVHIDADAEFIAFPRDRLIDFMGVLGYGKKE